MDFNIPSQTVAVKTYFGGARTFGSCVPKAPISRHISRLLTTTIGWVSADISAEYRLTYQPLVDRYLADSGGQHWLAERRLTYRPTNRPRLGRYLNWYLADSAKCRPYIRRHIDWVLADMSTDARSMCWLIHQSTCIPNISRHISRYATKMLIDTRQYVRQVSANM